MDSVVRVDVLDARRSEDGELSLTLTATNVTQLTEQLKTTAVVEPTAAAAAAAVIGRRCRAPAVDTGT